MAKKENPNISVKSAETLFQIVQTLQELDGAGVTEVANHLGIVKSSAHNYLTTLEELEYVSRAGDKYHVGLRFLDHGGFARSRNEALSIVEPRVRELAEETNEICHFALEEHGKGIVVFREEGKHAVDMPTRVGTRLYLHHFTTGKSILSSLPDDRVREIVERHGLPFKTDKTITNIDELIDEAQEIRNRGYAFDQEEHIPGLHAVSVPIEINNRILGGISVAGPSHRVSGNHKDEIVDLLLGVTNELELNLALQS